MAEPFVFDVDVMELDELKKEMDSYLLLARQEQEVGNYYASDWWFDHATICRNAALERFGVELKG